MGEGSGPTEPREFTFLFTDVVASTAFWDRAPERMDEAMARHDAILAGAVADHGGGLVKHTGDGMLAVFDRPLDGVLAAVDAQLALGREDWSPEAVIEARMGVHYGPAIHRSGDYFGTSPIRCVRIMALAAGGQILVSEDMAKLLHDLGRPHGLELRDTGVHRLRGLSRPERVYQVHVAGMRSEFPAPTGGLLLGALPRQRTSLVGRHDEVDALRELLRSRRMVTLVGPGGVGKSRLALRAASLEQDEHGRVVGHADVAPAYSSIVAHTVATAVGAPTAPGEAPLDALARALGDLGALLVIDNAEHVAGAVAELVDALLSRCPSLSVVVTSQVPMGVPDERVMTLEPLGIEPGGPATELFVDRARDADPRFDPRPHRDDIADLCRTLDGLPLAIELAAARTRSFEPAQILERLDHRLRFLRVPEGHPQARRGETLGAVIAWSHDLLDGDERLVLARLGVFRGPFTLASAEAVVGFDPIAAWEVADHLDRLVGRSLVTVQGRGAFRRYRLLESIAAFAAERLAAGSDEHGVRQRHARHYLAQLTHVEADHADRVDALDLESDNVRAAVAWSAADDPPTTARLLLGRYRILRDIGWHDDAHAWFGMVAAREPFDDPYERADLLQRLGQLSIATGRDLGRGRAALEDALAAAESVGDASRAQSVRLQLAVALSLYPASLDLDAATTHITALEAALAEHDDPWVAARVHTCAAFVHLYRRESREGATRAARARSAADRGQASALSAYARALEGANVAYAGEIERGLAEMEAAWDEADAAGDATVCSSVAWLRGYASVLLADPEDAIAWFQRGRRAGPTGNPVIRRSLDANRGIALVLLGRLDEADQLARDALVINGTLLQPLLTFAHADFEEVDRTSAALLERLRAVGDRNEYAAVSYWAGRFSNLLGRSERAVAHLSEALDIARRPDPCPYYEVPVRAELALLGDTSHLAPLRELAGTVPLRGLMARVHLAEAVAGDQPAAETNFARALEVAGRHGLMVDRVEILVRRSAHRQGRGDSDGRESDLEEAGKLLESMGLADRWGFLMEDRR